MADTSSRFLPPRTKNKNTPHSYVASEGPPPDSPAARSSGGCSWRFVDSARPERSSGVEADGECTAGGVEADGAAPFPQPSSVGSPAGGAQERQAAGTADRTTRRRLFPLFELPGFGGGWGGDEQGNNTPVAAAPAAYGAREITRPARPGGAEEAPKTPQHTAARASRSGLAPALLGSGSEAAGGVWQNRSSDFFTTESSVTLCTDETNSEGKISRIARRFGGSSSSLKGAGRQGGVSERKQNGDEEIKVPTSPTASSASINGAPSSEESSKHSQLLARLAFDHNYERQKSSSDCESAGEEDCATTDGRSMMRRLFFLRTEQPADSNGARQRARRRKNSHLPDLLQRKKREVLEKSILACVREMRKQGEAGGERECGQYGGGGLSTLTMRTEGSGEWNVLLPRPRSRQPSGGLLKSATHPPAGADADGTGTLLRHYPSLRHSKQGDEAAGTSVTTGDQLARNRATTTTTAAVTSEARPVLIETTTVTQTYTTSIIRVIPLGSCDPTAESATETQRVAAAVRGARTSAVIVDGDPRSTGDALLGESFQLLTTSSSQERGSTAAGTNGNRDERSPVAPLARGSNKSKSLSSLVSQQCVLFEGESAEKGPGEAGGIDSEGGRHSNVDTLTLNSDGSLVSRRRSRGGIQDLLFSEPSASDTKQDRGAPTTAAVRATTVTTARREKRLVLLQHHGAKNDSPLLLAHSASQRRLTSTAVWGAVASRMRMTPILLASVIMFVQNLHPEVWWRDMLAASVERARGFAQTVDFHLGARGFAQTVDFHQLMQNVLFSVGDVHSYNSFFDDLDIKNLHNFASDSAYVGSRWAWSAGDATVGSGAAGGGAAGGIPKRVDGAAMANFFDDFIKEVGSQFYEAFRLSALQNFKLRMMQ